MEVISFLAADGVQLHGALQGALHRGAGEASLPDDAIVFLHGAGSNFYGSNVLHGILPSLSKSGLAVLSINTRGHDSVCTLRTPNGARRGGAAFEVVDECRHDVRGAVDWLAERGYGSIALIGHSLGALKAIYSQAHDAHPNVARVIAVSPPLLSYAAFASGARRTEFLSMMSRAEQLVAAGEGDHLLNVTIPLPLLITAAGYVDKYGPAERYNLLTFANDVSQPTHYIFGQREIISDSEAFGGLDETVRRLGEQSGAAIDVSVVEGADHFYSGQTDALAEVMQKCFG